MGLNRHLLLVFTHTLYGDLSRMLIHIVKPSHLLVISALRFLLRKNLGLFAVKGEVHKIARKGQSRIHFRVRGSFPGSSYKPTVPANI